jgi:hypothetical protein
MFDFPNSPSVGQVYPNPAVIGQPQWKWDGSEWGPVALLGAQAPLGCKVQFFTASGTYTPSIGALYAVIEGVGGGGGGGGVAGVVTANANNGGGGGSGATYACRTLTIAQIGGSATVTVGAQGNGGASGANPGQNGGVTSVSSAGYGTIISCPGGLGGGGVSGVAQFGTGANSPGFGTGDLSIPGGPGKNAFYSNAPGTQIILACGDGGASAWGLGAKTASPGNGSTSTGQNASGYGAGGSGACFNSVAASAPGGNGYAGAVQITEYGNFGAAYSPPVRGAISGLTLSTAGGSTTMTAQPGQATDSTVVDSIALGSAINKTTAAWAAGSGVGGLDTGAIANNTWYKFFAIKNPATQATDLTFSLSMTPALPSGFTLLRYLGQMKIGGAGNWLPQVQNGNDFWWVTSVVDVSAGAPASGAQNTVTLASVPTGVAVTAHLRGSAGFASGGGTALWLYPTFAAARPSIGVVYNTVAGNVSSGSADVLTNTLAQIFTQLSYSGATTYNVEVLGWTDTRGRDA